MHSARVVTCCLSMLFRTPGTIHMNGVQFSNLNPRNSLRKDDKVRKKVRWRQEMRISINLNGIHRRHTHILEHRRTCVIVQCWPAFIYSSSCDGVFSATVRHSTSSHFCSFLFRAYFLDFRLFSILFESLFIHLCLCECVTSVFPASIEWIAAHELTKKKPFK